MLSLLLMRTNCLKHFVSYIFGDLFTPVSVHQTAHHVSFYKGVTTYVCLHMTFDVFPVLECVNVCISKHPQRVTHLF